MSCVIYMLQVPDYGLVVTQPMDLSTMRQKLEDNQYNSLDALEADFQLMISNCMAYNSKDTVSWREDKAALLLLLLQ